MKALARCWPPAAGLVCLVLLLGACAADPTRVPAMDANHKIAPAAVTIYHNPRCSNSRAALALLQEKGMEPQVVEYLNTPLNRTELQALAAATGLPLHGLLRSKEAAFETLDLGNPACTEEQLLDAVVAHPELLNRPIVSTPHGALLCRPPERVLELLERN